ncbi:unnamed protein product [Rhizophagus irregularis]|nr:unnamed protein product [Rhizophagus irregularis]
MFLITYNNKDLQCRPGVKKKDNSTKVLNVKINKMLFRKYLNSASKNFFYGPIRFFLQRLIKRLNTIENEVTLNKG